MSDPIKFPLTGNPKGDPREPRSIENVAPGLWRLVECDGLGTGRHRDLSSHENALVNSAYAFAHGLGRQVMKVRIDELEKQLKAAEALAAKNVAALAQVTAEACKRYDVGPYELGLANGLLLALATLREGEYSRLGPPPVWRHEHNTAWGRYRFARSSTGAGRILAACYALGWAAL